MYLRSIALMALTASSAAAQGQSGEPTQRQQETRIEVEMDTARIQSVKELPMLLYIVPWKDTELSTSQQQRRIVIHDLFGDFFDPVMPQSATQKEGEQ